jgi:phosphatidylserine/phosphatidylglycerophosphate/cardiolipin synthase-like enzyme
MRRSFVVVSLLPLSLLAACGSSGASAPSPSSSGDDAGATRLPDAAADPVDAGAEAEAAAPPPACSDTDPRNPPITLSVQPDDGEAPIVDVLAAAQHSIRVMIYDLGTSDILSTLVAKAQAKVPVKAILDATQQSFDQDAYDQLQAAGAQVKWSNPVFTYTHAKTIVVDETTSVVSTGNFDAEMIADERNYAMIDRDPQDVANLVSIFDDDWAGTTPNLSCTRLVVSPVNSQARIVAEIQSATQTLDIETLEFSDVPVQAAVLDRMKAGVAVRLLVADPGFSPGITTSVEEVAGSGLIARQLVTPQVHVKSILVDGKTAYAGSENFSSTSLGHNREVGLIVTEPAAVAKIAATFEKDWAASEPAVGTPSPPAPAADASAEAATPGDAASDAGVSAASTGDGG